MIKCVDCNNMFSESKIIKTTFEIYYGISDSFNNFTPFEYPVCPSCGSELINCTDNILNEEEENKMKRYIIDLTNTTMTMEEIFKLENYVWKCNKLIPNEMLEDE